MWTNLVLFLAVGCFAVPLLWPWGLLLFLVGGLLIGAQAPTTTSKVEEKDKKNECTN